MLNLSVLIEEAARTRPDKTAYVMGDVRLTFAQVNGMAAQVANALHGMGVERGDHVALSCPNVPYFPIVYYGILKAGAVVVPLNVLLKGREIAYHLQDSDAKVYFCFEGTETLPMAQDGHAGFQDTPACEHMVVMTANPAGPSPIEGVPTLGQVMAPQSPVFDTVQTTSEDTAVILYTSGTTGQPKGAELTHFNMFYNAVSSANLFQAKDDDITLIVLPLFHSYAQTCLMNAFAYAASTAVLLPRFDPAAVLGLLLKENVTVFAGVPTMYWALLNYPDADNFDLEAIANQLRLCSSGGSALPVEVLHRFEERYRVPILEGYGLSETSPVASFNTLDRERKPGSIGTPLWGVEMRVVDAEDKPVPDGETGEIVIRGHNVMKGYYQRPDVNAHVLRGDWFHTGDVGKRDADGYYYIVDRVKDMIIRGGLNVYPREIEEVLATHPAVSLAAVIGVPHDRHGEEVKAFVILKDGAEATPEEIVAWSKENMAAYKYPREVEIRATLPMTATGKILKTELRNA
ncbi:MAG: long-chain fatty acid--CoA ligase [Bacteroidota bacterium]